MAQPVLIRSPFSLGRWLAYLPCDDEGRWWWLVDMGYPIGDEHDRPGFCILGMLYGRARPGKLFQGYGGTDWTESGSWYDSMSAGTSDGSWMYRMTSQANACADLLIPAGHNEIQVFLYDVTGAGNVHFSWDDGSTDGLDMTVYTSTATRVECLKVATAAAPDGIRKLRISKENDTAAIRVIGVQSWDTDGEGDPAAAADGLACGHGLVHTWNTAVSGARLQPLIPSGDDSVVPFTYPGLGRAYEFAVYWDKSRADNTFRWTGGGMHLDKSDSANAVYLADNAAGPEIKVDAAPKGRVYAPCNDPDVPLKAILTGDMITIRSRGYADHDGSTTQNDADPDVEWSYTLTRSGLSVAAALRWSGAADLYDTQYSLMLPLNTDIIQPGDYFTSLPTAGRHEIYQPGANIHAPLGNSCQIHLAAMPGTVIELDSVSPLREIYYYAATDKLYLRVEPADLAGGTNPQAGDMMILAGRFALRRLKQPARGQATQGTPVTGAFV